jgi:hypothetical protein
MTEQTRPDGSSPLQFDHVVDSASSSSGGAAATCVNCGAAIVTDYYEVNGSVVCETCRTKIEELTETPRGIGPLVRAAAYGLGAGIVGALIYYGVIAFLHLEIGIVAILIGYMVGFAVRKGTGGRGGRRFQLLAVVLTYMSIALAYTPVVFGAVARQQATDSGSKTQVNAGTRPATPAAGRGAQTPVEASEKEASTITNPVLAGGFLLLFVASLPVLIVFGSLPSSLISAAIIFFGMSQAWRMTGAPSVQIYGPYRVGSGSAKASV